MTPMLELRDVSKRVGPAFALRAVSLEVEAGSCLGVVGPSGAGKTTLLRLVAGLEAPDQGLIRIAGEPVSGDGRWVRPYRRPVGLVFQGLALWPHMTVERHAFHGLEPGLPRRERWRRARAILDRLGLESLARRFPSELSGGERQRVALARALVRRPRVLLLDEPLASLDLGLRRSLLELLGQLKTEDSVAMVYVSHEREGLASLVDRIAVLDGGEIVESGDAAALLRSPRTAVARRLLLGVAEP